MSGNVVQGGSGGIELWILAIMPAHSEGPRIGAVVSALVDEGLAALVVDPVR